MPHILIGGRIHEAGLDLIRATPGIRFDMVDDMTAPTTLPLLEKTDAILVRTQTLPATLLEQAKNLKILSRHGVGYDNVPVEVLNRRHIPLCIVGDANSSAVAEHTLMLMLALAKRVIAYDRETRAGNWRFRDSQEATDLDGKTLLLLGFGRIGHAVAKRAAAFGLNIEVHDPYADPNVVSNTGATPTPSLHEALPRADFLSVHIPLIGSKAPIGAEELALLKPGAIVINTARGGIIDESALAEALTRGHISGAGLDVFVTEPPAPNHPLFCHDRVILTPHAAGLSKECAMRMASMAAQNILDFFQDKLDPALVVNSAHTSLAPAGR
ncbi:hydroxyacid dehydrogenase [Acidocella aminolytica]|jgi:D-3-phosphoglycerate dehydrogenase|uniref:D-isomer specific 2-hydroxyacid dehydrogenase n=1 Tax=Acidocella aminolytica 101 = DSM 11237 TaxID=1120923 RepID=A0A0D6PI81_9PROT|nr:hydroxyacid dehydrogenase [Acidocella aminolytica]GAN80534.1 D-isomer specific 2-hydroxyacid dehydrogenase [Acidocella aminolytica 101 = DSM 11237]GBQ37735.1 phosphoglycerate dehydrogenase [Acidocella aminolytica 101 = DSM 11237]SHF40050.1 D-3-phosphoglycerate dehydrogenase [Acidocella aminolytica 101 = DSM 11237]